MLSSKTLGVAELIISDAFKESPKNHTKIEFEFQNFEFNHVTEHTIQFPLFLSD